MNVEDTRAEVRREMERILGYPAGAFDPASNFFRDVDRINRALGEGFVLLEQVLGPQQILDRIEAGLDFPAAREVLELPRKMWELRPPPPDGLFGRY
ncbi:hypothetical protein ES703_17728 [subsurface metagenome]